MAASEKSKRKTWTREETILFLQCYAARKGEFAHSRKKIFAYTNVLKDMVCQGLADTNMTALSLECKMRSLLTAYKSAKDNSKPTGISPCIAPYMDLMDDLFGDKPLIASAHTIHLGGLTKPQFNDVLTEPTIRVSEAFLFSELKLEMESSSSHFLPIASPTPNIPSNPPTPSFSSNSSYSKRKSPRVAYYEGKLELEKMAIAAKLEQRRNFMNSYLEIDKQKVDAIQKLLEIKQNQS